MNKEYIMYAHKGPRGFEHIHSHIKSTQCYGSAPIIMVKVTLLEDAPLPKDIKEPVHIGWLYADKMDDPPVMVQGCLMMFEIQFTYGFQIEEKLNKGKAVVLRVEEIPKS